MIPSRPEEIQLFFVQENKHAYKTSEFLLSLLIHSLLRPISYNKPAHHIPRRPTLTTLTPYADVNLVLSLLLDRAKARLGPRLVGLYIHGSLAAGDFTPQRSDIDFVAVTAAPLPEDLLPGLAQMHAGIYASGYEWARKLEGSYVPQAALRRYDPQDCHFPALRCDGTFAVDGHGPDWVIQCHVLREHALVLAGPPIATLIDPVGPEDLRQATSAILREWWAPVLTDPTRLHTAEYRAYAVLTMCRGLYTLQQGEIVSKTQAATWCATGPGKPWAAMISHALAWRDGMPMHGIPETLALIRFTLAQLAG
jgi:hypothetical protein